MNLYFPLCLKSLPLILLYSPALLQVTQIRIAGDPSYETRFAFVEFAAPDQVHDLCHVSLSYSVAHRNDI